MQIGATGESAAMTAKPESDSPDAPLPKKSPKFIAKIKSLIVGDKESRKLQSILILSRHLNCGEPEIILNDDTASQTTWEFFTSRRCKTKDSETYTLATAGQVNSAALTLKIDTLTIKSGSQ